MQTRTQSMSGRWGVLVFAITVVVISTAAAPRYPGAIVSFATFSLCFAVLGCCALIRPFSYGYFFLAMFLVLGFWAKLAFRLLSGSGFVEPVGAFDGNPVTWDVALVTASTGAIGLILVRLLHVFLSRRHAFAGGSSSVDPSQPLPGWYVRYRVYVWVCSIAAIAALNLWNYSAAFYQIGVNPRVVLPLRLNIVLAWLLNLGFPIWLAALVQWEIRLGRGKYLLLAAAPIFEGLCASFSTLSRAAYLIHTMPYLLALFLRTGRLRLRLRWAVWVGAVCVVLCGLALSLGGVQVLRTDRFFFKSEVIQSEGVKCEINKESQTSFVLPPGVTIEQARAAYQREMFLQLGALVIERWVGLEGVLTIVSHPSRGMPLFVHSLREDPRAGIESTYQKLAGARYKHSDTFTFLTVPGIVALLALSGSLWVVLIGMIGVGVLVWATELMMDRWFKNDFLLAVIGASMAYVICQMNFPYLTAVFFGQLWVGLLCLALIQKVGSRQARLRTGTHN